MQGMFFAHISPDPKGVPGRMLIKQGKVRAAVGVGRWLLEFHGRGYNFANVFSAEALENFAFFNSEAERNSFIAELVSANTPGEQTSQVIAESPPSAEGQ
jgi:hypothetical protein